VTELIRLGQEGRGPAIYAENWTAAAALFGKLSRIMGNLGGIEKRGQADRRMGGYRFAQYEDVAAAVRARLAEENVAFLATVDGASREEITTSRGNTMVSVVLDLSFTFVDGDSGAMAICTWKGEANDTSDKATSKAVTLGLKYFLLRGFMLSTEGEMDPDAVNHPRASQRAPAPPPAREQATRRPTPTNGNGNGKPAIRTARWASVLEALAQQTDYYDEDGKINPYHVLGSLAKAGWTGDITDDNADEALRVLLAYAADEEKLEETSA